MRSTETARVKSGHKTGGKQSGAGKRKSATALANAAGIRAVKALAAKRKRPPETEHEIDELREEGEDGEEGEEESVAMYPPVGSYCSNIPDMSYILYCIYTTTVQ